MRHSFGVSVAAALVAAGAMGVVALTSTVASSVPAAASNPPVVTRISPISGPADTSIPVVIHGHGFDTAAGAVTVSFGSTPAVSVSCPSPSSCTVVTPNLPEGVTSVTLVTNGTTLNSEPFTVNAYSPPLVRLVLSAKGHVEFSSRRVTDKYPAQGAPGNDYILIENQTAVSQSLTTNLLGPATIAAGAEEGFSMPADNGPYIFFTSGTPTSALTVDTKNPA